VENATLRNKETVDAFRKELGDNQIDELVLLGDLFDLWKAVPKSAISESIELMSALGKMAKKVTYIVGNHDYHIFLMCQESKFLEGLQHSKFEDLNFSLEQDFGSDIIGSLISDGCIVDVQYARYWKDHLGVKLLFMHGHHLDGVQTFVPDILTSIDLFLSKLFHSAKIDDEEKLEAAIASSYEPLYRNAVAGELVTVENGVWQIPSFFGLLKGHVCKTLRFTPVEQMYSTIESYLTRFTKKPDVFVYGHTHLADAYRKGDGVLAVNTGCWLTEEDPSVWNNPEEIPNTYVMIDDAVTVKQLGKEKPLVGPFNISDVRTLQFKGRNSVKV